MFCSSLLSVFSMQWCLLQLHSCLWGPYLESPDPGFRPASWTSSSHSYSFKPIIFSYLFIITQTDFYACFGWGWIWNLGYHWALRPDWFSPFFFSLCIITTSKKPWPERRGPHLFWSLLYFLYLPQFLIDKNRSIKTLLLINWVNIYVTDSQHR